MELNRTELELACLELARRCRVRQTAVDDVLARSMVEGYVRSVEHHAQFLREAGRDPNFLVRAVRYLAQTQAIPPLEGNLEWFASAVDTLVELACPNGSVDREQIPFFAELMHGIAEALSDAPEAREATPDWQTGR